MTHLDFHKMVILWKLDGALRYMRKERYKKALYALRSIRINLDVIRQLGARQNDKDRARCL
jgi:hypothetical protein